MASVLRSGLCNLSSAGLIGGLCKVIPKHRHGAITQICFISSQEQRVGRPPRPPPFDWKNKEYNYWQYLTDPMEERFDDNTKLVVVEGLPGLGKDKLARYLAESLEMLYLEPVNFNDLYINPYGFDMRSLNPKLPEDAQCFDIASFLENPTGRNSAVMQLTMFAMRCYQYLDALSHLLSTGQGVVIQRSPFSDPNFMQAMLQNGYVSKGASNVYKSALATILPELLRPHLVVYLDASISTIKDNIKKRNCPYEVNSKALTDKYLQDLADLYKDNYLRELTKHSHLLIYDWNKPGDASVIVEDIERLDFETMSPNDEKFLDWRYDHIYTLKMKRGDYTRYRNHVLAGLHVTNFDVPEMWRSAEDSILLEKLLSEVPSEQYAAGFNPAYDKGLLFKLHEKPEDLSPRGQVVKQE